MDCPLPAFATFRWGLDQCVLCGGLLPFLGDCWRSGVRPERSSDFRARTIPSDVVRKSALASSVGTLRFQLAYCSTLFETGLAGNRAVNMMPDLSNAAYRDERQNS